VRVRLEDPGALRPYEPNPRVNDHAVDAVAASIQEYGFRQPIVVDEDSVIISGHTRWKAARKLGLKKVPVHRATGLTPEQARSYRIADNKLGELAEWDFDRLRVELADLQASDVDLELLGFNAAELEHLLGPVHGNPGQADPDAIPAPPDEAVTKPGDIWQLGDHRLLCGDSSKPEDLDELLAGERIQLLFTDPPYNVNVEPRSNNAVAAGAAADEREHHHHQEMDKARRPGVARATDRKLRPKDRPLANDFLPPEEFEKLLAAWFGNAARVLVPGGSFYIWGGYANLDNYPPALAGAKLYFSQAVIWVKEHPVLTRKDFMGNHEWCFYGWREGAGHYFNPKLKNVTDVWRLSRASEGKVGLGRGVNLEAPDGARISIGPPNEKFRDVSIGDLVDCYCEAAAADVWSVRKVSPQAMVHLTEKPVELAERAMIYSSRPGDNVLDLFGGSGSTLIGAERTGRRAFLSELDPLYCDVIVKRFEEYSGAKAELVS